MSMEQGFMVIIKVSILSAFQNQKWKRDRINIMPENSVSFKESTILSKDSYKKEIDKNFSRKLRKT